MKSHYQIIPFPLPTPQTNKESDSYKQPCSNQVWHHAQYPRLYNGGRYWMPLCQLSERWANTKNNERTIPFLHHNNSFDQQLIWNRNFYGIRKNALKKLIWNFIGFGIESNKIIIVYFWNLVSKMLVITGQNTTLQTTKSQFSLSQ